VISWASALSSIERWPDSLRSRIAGELWRQAGYLRRSIEHDVGGNHVLKNATALTVAGVVFERSPLLERGLRLLRRELERQILSDGGHEERSTSYHREVRLDLEDVAVLIGRVTGSTPDWLGETIARMAAWEAEMMGPDGTVPLLNDAWEGPPQTPSANSPAVHLAESGYVVLRDRGDQAVFDVGPICPRHLPAHAHADVLSFVLWADGRSLLVDPGSYAYTGERRDRFRGTAAHNTVEVDGRDQCEFWGDFRAARQPRVRALPLRRQRDVVIAAASHDGYRRLSHPVTHHRALVWSPNDGVVAVDMLRGRGIHEVRSSLHVAPGAPLEGSQRLGPFRITPLGAGAHAGRREGEHAPYLGSMVRAPVLEDRRSIGPDVPFGWSLLREGAEVSELGADALVLRRCDGSALTVRLPLG
jgi:uncharacterized heparinase superfamily protein